jgi:tyrosyl-tRNA synthetase
MALPTRRQEFNQAPDLLHQRRRCGEPPHNPLMGGGTTRVGDPPGKDECRRLLAEEAINENIKSIRATFTPPSTSNGGAPAYSDSYWAN